MNSNFEKRFWNKVETIPETCWLWKGARNGAYGTIIHKSKHHMVHRVAYELTYGPIPEGLQIDHLCRTTLCINPLHLEAIDLREHTLRDVPNHKAWTKCRNSHTYSDQSIYISPSGTRKCRICRNNLVKQRRERQRAIGIR